MSDRDSWNSYQWQGLYGDIEADEADAFNRLPRRERPKFTRVRNCVRCDGFMIDVMAYAHVDEETATVCHHCRGLIRCKSGHHHIQRSARCVVCEVFHGK